MTVTNIPAATTQTLFYTATSQFYASNIFMCAVGAPDAFSLGIKPSGATQIAWLYSGLTLKSGETFVVTALSLSEGDEVYVQSTGGRVHFTMTGDKL